MRAFDLAVRGATIITPSGPPGSGLMRLTHKQVLGVSEDRVVAVGPESEWQHVSATIEIDGRKRVVIPGLVNAHTHLFQTLARGRGDGLVLRDWASDAIWAVAPLFTPRAIRAAALLACIESLESGVTTVADSHYLRALARGQGEVAEACLESGIRAVLGRTAMDTALAPQSDREVGQEAVRRSLQFADEWHGRANRLTVRFEAMNEELASPDLVIQLRSAAAEQKVGFGMHLAETRERARKLRRRYGKGPVEWLRSIGCLGPDVLLSHCVWLRRDELRLLAESGTGVAHNPISNAFLADGTAMLTEMIEDGVHVGLGTDGAASNNSMSVLESAKAAVLLQRARTRTASSITAGHVLELATIGGARALGMEHDIGSIEVGKCADFVVLDLAQPSTTPSERLVETIVYSGDPRMIETVVVAGRVVVNHGRVSLVDRYRCMREVAEFSARLT